MVGFAVGLLFMQHVSLPMPWFLVLIMCLPIAAFIEAQILRAYERATPNQDYSLPGRQSITSPVLLIRAASDEASLALASAQFLSTILTRILKLSSVVVHLAGVDDTTGSSLVGERYAQAITRRFRSGLGAMLFAASALAFLVSRFDPAGDHSKFLIASAFACVAGVSLLYLSFVIGVLLTPISVAITLLLILSVLPVGPALALRAFRLQFSVEATPPGKWEIHQIGTSHESVEDQSKMQHGTHSNPVALIILEDWLRLQGRCLWNSN